MNTMNLAMIKKNINNKIDLSKTLEQLAIKQQYNYYKVATYDLVFNYITFLEMINDEDTTTYLKIDNQSEDIITFITSILKDYKGLESCMLNTKDLLDFRNILESKMIVLTGYADEVEIYEYIINRIEGRFIQDYYELEDDDSFAGSIIRFIFENEENMVINEKIKVVMSQLPVRITKNKFYEYMEHSLEIYKGAYVTDLNNYIKMVKDSIMPRNIKEYDDSFEDIRHEIGVLEKADYKNIDQQEFEHIYKMKMDVADKINGISAVYTLVVSLINNLIELSLCDKFDLFMDEKDLLDASRLLKLIGENVDGFVLDEHIAKALEDIEGVIENSMDDIDKYSHLVQMAIQKHQKQLENFNQLDTYENMQKLDYMASTSSYFVNPNITNMEDDDNRVDDFTLAKAKKNLIQDVDGYIKDKSREYRRAIMGHLFYLLPVSFKSPQEVHAYVLHSLQQCSDINEKNASKELIRQVMDDLSI